jgi:hypothetical protein
MGTKARGTISNWQTVSNRSTGSTTAGAIVFAARKRHAKQESSQLLGDECEPWPAASSQASAESEP